MQFHPTALHHPQMPRPLLSEALRGHGAVLRDATGERFVDELASRDVVAQAMTARMLEQGTDHLWLDATRLEAFGERFPTIAAAVRAIGLDPTVDWLPIAPAAHYLSGGIVTDLCGASALPGLWACGEVACTGVHGANRLASNSLLEGMVFAPRVIEAIEAGRDEPRPTGAMRAVLGGDAEIPGRALSMPSLSATTGADDAEKLRSRLQRTMTAGAGVLRDAASLDATAAGLADVARVAADPEVRNLAEAGWALVHAARAREESRGAHSRLDFPGTLPEFLVRLVIS
jgi:L-aspartate oxidase